MKKDKEIENKSLIFKKKFGYYINEFKGTNKDLKYISLLSLGNINYIKGNYSEAIDLYEKILKGEEVKEEIKKKAENNKDKADNKIKGN
ncbi:MAG: tetratricopeptide repeat protein [Ignavibacteria bacterium]|nr:tetratricopeptide repeat protein [Ignavibacteria bacterium]